MTKSTSTKKSTSYSLPIFPQGRIVNLKTGESTPYGQQEMPRVLFDAVLAEAAAYLGYTLRRR